MLQNVSVDIVLSFVLIFARLGMVVFYLPMFGDKYIFPKERAAFALGITALFYPLILHLLPSNHVPVMQYMQYLAAEFLIGIMLGLSVKIIFLSLHTVGTVMAMQSGLGSAMFYDISQKEQTAVFTAFLFLTAIMAIIVTDTHYLFIKGALDSYSAFPPGKIPNSGDMSNFMSEVVNTSFLTSFKLVSPFLVVSTCILTGAGILSRLMPNLQVFFVLTPVQIIATFITLIIVLQVMLEHIVNAVQKMATWKGI